MDRVPNGAVDFSQLAQQQAEKEQVLRLALQTATESPHTIERLTIAAFAVRQEGEEKILSVATPDGKRRDFPINAVVEQSLRLALFPRENREAA